MRRRTDRDGADKPPFDCDSLKQRWKDEGLYGVVHLTFAGCLGRCNTANQAMLVSHDKPHYFMKLDAHSAADALVQWAVAAKTTGRLPPFPDELNRATYQRMVTSKPVPKPSIKSDLRVWWRSAPRAIAGWNPWM